MSGTCENCYLYMGSSYDMEFDIQDYELQSAHATLSAKAGFEWDFDLSLQASAFQELFTSTDSDIAKGFLHTLLSPKVSLKIA